MHHAYSILDKPAMLVARVDEKISGLTFDPVYGRIYWTELNKRQSVLYTDSNGNKLTTLYRNRENARNIVSCFKTGLAYCFYCMQFHFWHCHRLVCLWCLILQCIDQIHIFHIYSIIMIINILLAFLSRAGFSRTSFLGHN